MKNFVSLKNVLLGGASVVAVGMFMGPALAQDQMMETVVVTGIRASLQSAQSIKQNADQVVDSITAVDIGALPDRNIAEALQRVPGVTLQRTDTTNDLVRLGSIGNNVFIRGLAWVKSLVNGRDEFTAVAGRSLSFGDVSADLMQAVNVYKSPTASQIEGGVGGTVDLITRKPFDHDGRLIAVSGDYTYGDLIDVGLPSGNALISDRFNTRIGEIGILASVDWQELTNRTNGINLGPYSCWDVAHSAVYAPKDTGYAACEALPAGATSRLDGPQGWAWRQMEWKQQRLASNLVLQWRPNEKLEFTLFAMNTYAHNQDMEHYVYNTINLAQTQAGQLRNNVWTGSDSTLSSIDARGGSGHNRNTDVSLTIKYTPTDKLDLTADIQAVESASPYRNMTFYTQPLVGVSTGINVANRDDWRVSYVDAPTNSQASNYIYPFAMDHLQYNSAHSVNARLDATYRFDGAGVFGLIKSVQGGFRTEQKIAVSRSTGWNWSFVNQNWIGNSYVTLDGVIHGGGGQFVAQDGTTYTSATGNLQAVIDQAELFHYQKILGNTFPALWAPKSSLARMNTIQSFHLMSAMEPRQGVWTWYTGDQSWGQWISYAAEHGCTGDDITCLNAYNLTPGANSSGNRKSKQNEQTYAGYLQFNFAYDTLFGHEMPWEGNLGVRYVRTNDQVSAGMLVMPSLSNGFCTVGSDVTLHQSTSCADWNAAVTFLGGVANQNATLPRPSVKSGYTNWLPSFNMAIHTTDHAIARMAYSETILRPDFAYTYGSASLAFSFYGSATNQYGIFNGDPTGIGGNPYLKPMKAYNYDASYEWYFSSSGSLTVNAFYKTLTNYIFTATTTQAITSPAGQTMNFDYTTYVNGDKGKVGGFELGYQQFYDFLPGWWGGFGFQANYTHIWNQGGHNTGSDITNAVAIAAANDRSLPMEGMSDDTYNLALMYAKYGIDARLAWNWRSMYLSSSSDANNKIPTWLEAYGQLDGSMFYSFWDHYKIGVQVTNILALPFHSDNGYVNFHPRGNTIETDRKYAIVFRTSW